MSDGSDVEHLLSFLLSYVIIMLICVQLMLKYLPIVQSDWSSEMSRRR